MDHPTVINKLEKFEQRYSYWFEGAQHKNKDEVGKRSGVQASRGVRAAAAIYGQEAIEIYDFIQTVDYGFEMKQSDRQVKGERHIIHMC